METGASFGKTDGKGSHGIGEQAKKPEQTAIGGLYCKIQTVASV